MNLPYFYSNWIRYQASLFWTLPWEVFFFTRLSKTRIWALTSMSGNSDTPFPRVSCIPLRSQLRACFWCLSPLLVIVKFNQLTDFCRQAGIKKVHRISDRNKKGTPFIRHRRPEYEIYSLPQRFFWLLMSVPFFLPLYEYWIRRFSRIWVIWWFWG